MSETILTWALVSVSRLPDTTSWAVLNDIQMILYYIAILLTATCFYLLLKDWLWKK